MGLGNLILFGSLKTIARDLIFRDIRIFFAELLSALYAIVGILLQVIYAVADLDNLSVFSEMYSGIQERFYIIIGIVMLFKVSMSMITYFANPDKLTDKEAGMGKVITRMITVLILLIFVPTFVFPFLGEIQPKIIETVGKVVMDSDFALNPDTAHSAGQNIATTILSGFFTYNEECGGSGGVEADNILEMAVSYAEEACPNDKKMFKYQFNWLMAFIAIAPIIVIIIIIGVQVAIRAFKLIILKVLAPIPIIYYMDPKSMKDGGKTSAYVKLFITTYLDLFIHFAALFFAVALMNRLSLGFLVDFLKITWDTAIFGLVFLVIGLLLFAFQAPKFIKKALGLKDSEFGSGLAGLLTTGAAMAGAVGSGVAGFAASKAAPGSGHFIQNFGAAASSAISGARTGYKAAGDKSDSSKVLSAIRAKNLEMSADRTAGITFGVRARELFDSTFKGIGTGASQKSKVDTWDSIIGDVDKFFAAQKKEATKGKYDAVSLGAGGAPGFTETLKHKDASRGAEMDYGSITGKSKDLRGVLEQAKAAGATTFKFGGFDYTDENGNHYTDISVSEGDFLISELEKREQAVFQDKLDHREGKYYSDNADLYAELDSIKTKIERAGSDLSGIAGVDDRITDGFKNMDSQMKLVKAESVKTKNSTEYIAAVAASKKNK